MATTEATLDNSSKTQESSAQIDHSVPDDSPSNANVSADAFQDVADILAMLDDFGASQSTTDQSPKDTPLADQEQGEPALSAEDTEPTIQSEADEQEPPVLDEHEQVKLDDLLGKAKSQLDAMAVDGDALSKELARTESHVTTLEHTENDNKDDTQYRADMNKEVTHLCSELHKMTTVHRELVSQVQKQFTLLEEANANREDIETELRQARRVIRSMQHDAKAFQTKDADRDEMLANLRTQLLDETAKLRSQLVDQTGSMTAIHEKLQNEVAQRRTAEKMLREIGSRVVQLTQSKPGTQGDGVNG